MGMKKEYIVELREEEADELMDEHWVGELVRCKDCKYCYFADNRIPCERENVCGRNGTVVTPEWFCADGEHKELEGEA